MPQPLNYQTPPKQVKESLATQIWNGVAIAAMAIFSFDVVRSLLLVALPKEINVAAFASALFLVVWLAHKYFFGPMWEGMREGRRSNKADRKIP